MRERLKKIALLGLSSTVPWWEQRHMIALNLFCLIPTVLWPAIGAVFVVMAGRYEEGIIRIVLGAIFGVLLWVKRYLSHTVAANTFLALLLSVFVFIDLRHQGGTGILVFFFPFLVIPWLVFSYKQTKILISWTVILGLTYLGLEVVDHSLSIIPTINAPFGEITRKIMYVVAALVMVAPTLFTAWLNARADKILQEQQQKEDSQRLLLEQVTSMMPLIAALYDTQQERYVFQSRSILGTLGWSMEQIQDVDRLEPEARAYFIHPEDRAVIRDFNEQCKHSDEVVEVVFRLRTPQNTWRWFRRVGRRVDNWSESNPLIVNTFEDISVKMLADEQYRISEKRFRTLVENAQEPIWSVDAEGRLTAANEAFLSITSIPQKAVVLHHILEDYLQGPMLNTWRSAIATVIAGEYVEFEYRVPLPLEERYFIVSVSPIAENSTVVGAVAFAKDITERKQYEQSLRQVNETLEKKVEERTAELLGSAQALEREVKIRRDAEFNVSKLLANEQRLSAMRSRFIGLISHEFRTPMTVIRSSSALIAQALEKEGETSREIAGQMARKVENGIAQMVDILDGIDRLVSIQNHLSRTSNGCVPIAPGILACIDEFKASLPKGRSLRLHAAVPDTTNTEIDTLVLQTAVGELADNAFKYGTGSVEVNIYTSPTHVVFAVASEGAELEAEEQSLQFELFHRGQEQREIGRIRGLGLGLPIAKLCAEHVGGTLRYQHRDGANIYEMAIPICCTAETTGSDKGKVADMGTLA